MRVARVRGCELRGSEGANCELRKSLSRPLAKSPTRQVDCNDVGWILLYIKLTRFDLRIQGFKNSGIQGFKDSRIQRFKDSTI